MTSATNRGLYNPTNGRGLYNAATGRMLYGGVWEKTLDAPYWRISTYNEFPWPGIVDGVKTDIWPEVRDNFPYTWINWTTTPSKASSVWTRTPAARYVNADALCAYMRHDTSAYSGLTISAIRITVDSYSRPDGAGAPMVGITAQSSSTAGSNYTWLAGQRSVEISATGEVTLEFESLTLGNYLFLTSFISDHEPPTAKDAIVQCVWDGEYAVMIR